MTQALRLVKRFRDWVNLLRQIYLCWLPPRTLKPEEMFARDTLDRRAIQTYAAGYRSSTYGA
jgi:hypothetical protein